MAHMIETAAYAITAAWHKLGVIVDHAMTAKEAILAAGLDWEVFIDDTYCASDGTKSTLKCVRRRDTGAIVGEGVTADYKPIQNWEAFEFMDGLVGEYGLKYESAMSLRGGSEICLLARMPGDMVISKGKTKAGEKRGAFRDIVEKYLFLRTGHDGKTACLIIPTSTRVVCANTSRMAVEGAVDWVEITHAGNMEYQLEEARKALMGADKAFKLWERDAKRMAETELKTAERDEVLESWLETNFGWKANGTLLLGAEDTTEEVTANLLDAVIDKSDAKAEKARERREKKYTGMLDVILSNTVNVETNPGNPASAWALYNAVTQEVDHGDSFHHFRGNDLVKAEKLLSSTVYGDGAVMKELAWELCAKAAGIELPALAN